MTETHGNNQMDPKTLEALKASIAKWEANVEAETPLAVLLGADYCPLCYMFFDYDCIGCPVSNRTGRSGCYNTPYYRATNAHRQWAHGRTDREEWRVAAQAEVDFLKSLLPGETP